MASCSDRAYLLTWETGFRITTTRQCDVNSNEIGMYWMTGSPEKGFDLLFWGVKRWSEEFVMWVVSSRLRAIYKKKKWTSPVGFERRVWANTSWESLVGSGHLQWEDNRETTLAWKEGWKRRLRSFNRPDREAFSWDRQVWERGCYNSVNDMEDGPWLDTLRKKW